MRSYSTYETAACLRDVRRECKEIGKGWIKLNEDLHLLERHKKSLKEDWAQIESQRERLVRARMHFEKAVRQEWFLPGGVDADGVDTQRTVRLNIGGERFDIKASLLLKDRFSLLAATTVPPEDAVIKPEADGCFYFDRDWWLFRHVLAYLRDGILPIKQPLLRDLYHEAAFYCLTSLQREIHIALTKLRDEAKPTRALRQSRNSSKVVIDKPAKSKQRDKAAKKPRHRQRVKSGAPLPDPFGFVSHNKESTRL